MEHRLQDILKEKNIKLFPSENELSKQGVISEMAKHGWQLKDRTVDYYVRFGIIRKPHRKPGDKSVYWKKDYIVNELLAVKTLVETFHQNLSIIHELAKATRFQLENTVVDVFGMCEALHIAVKKFHGAEVEDIATLGPVYRTYFRLVKDGKMCWGI